MKRGDAEAVMNIGVIDISSPYWTAGRIFTKVVLHGLVAAVSQKAGFSVSVISDQKSKLLPDIREIFPLHPSGRRRQRGWLDRIRQRKEEPLPSLIENTMAGCALDVVIPVIYTAATLRTTLTGAMIGWIPDFQHVFLPEFFDAAEIVHRQKQVDLCAQSCDRVLFSSNDALSHFRQLHPEFNEKGRAIPFPSIFAFEKPEPFSGASIERFRLPAKYLLVANQFWAHKNHISVIRALAILRERGITIPVVFTGQLSDHRAAGACVVSAMLQEAAASGIWDQVRFLGFVSRGELLDLVRSAAAVIQPSRFEGWSTTVQDARALGRPVICSDIPVHREQAPDAEFFFSPQNPEDLANKLQGVWDGLPSGYSEGHEEQALARESEFAKAYGDRLLGFCKEACRIS